MPRWLATAHTIGSLQQKKLCPRWPNHNRRTVRECGSAAQHAHPPANRRAAQPIRECSHSTRKRSKPKSSAEQPATRKKKRYSSEGYTAPEERQSAVHNTLGKSGGVKTMCHEQEEKLKSSAVQPAMTPDPHHDSLERTCWTITACEDQPLDRVFEKTHTRPCPLPLALDLQINDTVHRCLYIGHGKNKCVYRLTDGGPSLGQAVLKLTETEDIEPHLCNQLSKLCNPDEDQPTTKMCPDIYGSARCLQLDADKKPVREWFAWIAEYAEPLDKYMQAEETHGLHVDRKACLKIALYKQILAAKRGLLFADNNLFNFGVIANTVVIIDAGDRDLQPQAITKGNLNYGAIHKWWKKLAWQCKSEDFAECRTIWQYSQSLDEVAEQLKDVCLSCDALQLENSSVAQPAAAITQTPSVWSLLEPAEDTNGSDGAVQWLLTKCFHGKLGSLKLLQTGEVIPLENGEFQPPNMRLETLIVLTQERRRRWIRCDEEIMPLRKLQKLLRQWRLDKRSWMSEAGQADWHKHSAECQHHLLRSRFRAFLFHMCGCYELVIFWLRVKPSWHSLCIFYDVFAQESEHSRRQKLEMAVEKARPEA